MPSSALTVVPSVPDPATALPLTLHLDDGDSPRDVVDALTIARFGTGEHPFAYSATVKNLRSSAPLLPAGATVLRTARSDGEAVVLAGGDGWLLRSIRYRDHADVTVTAVSHELAKSVLDEAVQDASEPPAEDEGVVRMGFWHHSAGRGPWRQSRDIEAPRWPDIRGNYASSAAGALDQLMRIDADHVSGRILLLHGPPGTGKTTALRALARAWKSWCQLDCVLDPERLFGEPSYLLEVVMGKQHDCGDPQCQDRWRLLLLEDCDELIRGEAKQSAGQALSRLLNLTDGLLGQGRRILVGVTTNEDLTRLHPAVTRSGRCLAQIAVGALPADEAERWLGTSEGIGPDGATLADLYALRTAARPVTAQIAAPATGMYL